MTQILPPIIFFGTEQFSLTALTGLLEASYPIEAVVTKPDTKRGRGQILTSPPVKVLASKHNIPVWQPEKLSDITSEVQALESPVGILSSYGKIIPQNIIDLFHPGIINIHPSLLPKYRGSTPIESAIKNGDNKTGVSIMLLSAQMDQGPVYASKEYILTQAETKLELYHALADIGTNLLLETLPQILDGSLSPLPQDETLATYTPRLSKEDAWLDLSEMTAAEAERTVRAHLGFPKTKVTINGHTVIVTKAKMTEQKHTETDLACKGETFLSIEELIAPSGRRMSTADFERGYLRS